MQELISDTLDLEVQILFIGSETKTKENIDKLYEKLSSTYGIDIEPENIDTSNIIKKIS